MASTIGCDMCGQERAQVMQSNMDNGDVLAVGPNCLLVFYLTVAQEMLDLMPAENKIAYGEALADIVVRLGGNLRPVAEATAAEYDENPATGDMMPLAPESAEADV